MKKSFNVLLILSCGLLAAGAAIANRIVMNNNMQARIKRPLSSLTKEEKQIEMRRRADEMKEEMKASWQKVLPPGADADLQVIHPAQGKGMNPVPFRRFENPEKLAEAKTNVERVLALNAKMKPTAFFKDVVSERPRHELLRIMSVLEVANVDRQVYGEQTALEIARKDLADLGLTDEAILKLMRVPASQLWNSDE